MPRVWRGLADGEVYHVLNRGNGRQVVFHKDGDYEAFLKLIREGKERFPVKVLAYCLMSNHFHLLVKPAFGRDLSKWMQWIMTSHVRRYHRHYGTSGHVWQGRFKSFLVESGDHLLTVMRYIEGNPLRAKMVTSASDWQWSSLRERLAASNASLTDIQEIELPSDWAKYVDLPLSEKELEKLNQSIQRQAPFGSDAWKERVVAALGLESTLRLRGRPKKVEEKNDQSEK